jgi:ribosome maturation factor RimP
LITALAGGTLPAPSWWFSNTRDPNPGPAFFFHLPAMSTHVSPAQLPDRAALQRVVEPIVRAHGAEVVDLELRPERGGWILRIYVEKAGAAAHSLSTREAAVNLELCANVSRDLSPALDVADLIPQAYHLEVSSPGVERPLRAERDFARFTGQKAKLRLREPVDGQRVLVGVLDGASEGKVRIVLERQGPQGSLGCEVPLSSIERARLVFEFGSSGKHSRPQARAQRGSGRDTTSPQARAQRGTGRDTTQRKH